MKRIYQFMLLGLILLLAACTEKESELTLVTGQTITVALPQNAPAYTPANGTKATPGDGSQINRCIMAVYHGSTLYGKYYTTVTGNTATFTGFRLVSGQTYQFVFWADHVTSNDEAAIATDLHYNTTDLTAITLINDPDNSPYTGNNDEFDAFTATISKEVHADGKFSFGVDLTRPFGQLNVFSSDIATIPEATGLKPTKANITLQKVYTTYNALSGQPTGEKQDLTYTADIPTDAATTPLTIDYILAPTESKGLVDYAVSFLNGETDITSRTVTNLPIQRNYRTNVKGNLVTKEGEIAITVSKDFSQPDEEVEIKEVATVQEANVAMANGETYIVITQAPTDEAVIVIPKAGEAKDISIQMPETNVPVKAEYSSTTTGVAPSKVNITMSNVSSLTINLPESTVTLNGETYSSVTATTADNTLVIGEGTTVETLTINKGNVEIYGIVTNPIIFNGTTAGIVKTYNVTTADALQYAVQLTNEGKCERTVILADMDIANSGVVNISADMNLTIADGVTVTTARQATGANIVVNDGAVLTVDGNGTVSGDNRLIDVNGKIIVNGGHYRTSTKNRGSILTINPMGEAVIENCDMLAANCALWIEGKVTINGGKIVSTNSSSDPEVGSGWSYAIRTIVETADLTINDGEVEGVQGAVGMYAGKITINGGYFHTHPKFTKSDNFYALYCADAMGEAIVNGGKFYAEGRPDVYCTNTGKLSLKGGKFEDQGHDESSNGILILPEGYIWDSISEDQFKYEVVIQ